MTYIKIQYPLIWKYVTYNKYYFLNCKNNIYNNVHEYGIISIGEYTFKEYKVAICVFYVKRHIILAYDDKSMIHDELFINSFDSYAEAHVKNFA